MRWREEGRWLCCLSGCGALLWEEVGVDGHWEMRVQGLRAREIRRGRCWESVGVRRVEWVSGIEGCGKVEVKRVRESDVDRRGEFVSW